LGSRSDRAPALSAARHHRAIAAPGAAAAAGRRRAARRAAGALHAVQTPLAAPQQPAIAAAAQPSPPQPSCTLAGPTGVEWLPVAGIAHALYQELGYEDMDEFEDSLSGTFAEFLGAMPHVRVRTSEDGRQYFQLVPEPPQEQWVPSRMTFKVRRRRLPGCCWRSLGRAAGGAARGAGSLYRLAQPQRRSSPPAACPPARLPQVTSTSDLWRVCLKSPHATVEIPELEFEISADGKKRIDSLYNHIAQAVFNLGNHVQVRRQGGASGGGSWGWGALGLGRGWCLAGDGCPAGPALPPRASRAGARSSCTHRRCHPRPQGMGGTMSSEHAQRIMETVTELNKLLDVEKPFTWIVHDPSGMSEFKPVEGVEVLTGGRPAGSAAPVPVCMLVREGVAGCAVSG
jgi:hypothetical protein